MILHEFIGKTFFHSPRRNQPALWTPARLGRPGARIPRPCLFASVVAASLSARSRSTRSVRFWHAYCSRSPPRCGRRCSSWYQVSLIMTHRDGFQRLSARSAWRGDAGHRKTGAPSTSIGMSARVIAGESLGKPPFRSSPPIPGGRQEALTMPRRTRGSLPTRRKTDTISMSLYH